MLDAEAFTPTLVLEPRLMELFVPRDWLKLAVPVPEKFTTPAVGVTMLNICSGSALAVPAMNGAAASTAATKRGRFMMLSSKWSPPKAGLFQDWTNASHETAANLPIALGSSFSLRAKGMVVVP